MLLMALSGVEEHVEPLTAYDLADASSGLPTTQKEAAAPYGVSPVK
jgi:hypothetical protein